MGANDWMLMYAEREIRPVLHSAPVLDRDATWALARRLYPGHQVTQIADGSLLEQASPADDRVYTAVFPSIQVGIFGRSAPAGS